MNLTDRQKVLIYDLLYTYQFYCKENYYEEDYQDFVFGDRIFKIGNDDWKVVCEIIDYIKGVKS